MAENGPVSDKKVVVIAVDRSKQAEYAVNCKSTLLFIFRYDAGCITVLRTCSTMA